MMGTKNNLRMLAWTHEIRSFVILLYDVSLGGNSAIYKEDNKIYSLRIDEKQMHMGNATNLYEAFIWFHNNLEEYHEKIYRAWDSSRCISFGHGIYSHSCLYDILFLCEMVRVCIKEYKKGFELTPFKFYRIFMGCHSTFQPGLNILDLQTDIESQKNKMYDSIG